MPNPLLKSEVKKKLNSFLNKDQEKYSILLRHKKVSYIRFLSNMITTFKDLSRHSTKAIKLYLLNFRFYYKFFSKLTFYNLMFSKFSNKAQQVKNFFSNNIYSLNYKTQKIIPYNKYPLLRITRVRFKPGYQRI